MKKEIFTIPNILCYIRFLLVPLFLYYYMQGDYVLSSCIILIGSITDFLDGYIARHYNMVTQLGKAIDPLADKVMQLAIAIALASRYPMMIMLLILFVVKELFQGICCLVGLKKHRRMDGAMWFGKVSTAVFYVLTFALIAFPQMNIALVSICCWITTLFMGFAFIKYIQAFYRLLHDV